MWVKNSHIFIKINEIIYLVVEVIETDIYMIVRKNIKKYRMLRGITQFELAEKIDVSHDFIRQIESEKVSRNFSLQTLFDISVELNIDIKKFFEI